MRAESKKFWQQDGTFYTIWIKVRASSRRPGFQGILEGEEQRLIWGVSASPEKGKANRELVHALADVLRLPVRAVEIISGETNNLKTVRIDAAAMLQISDLPEILSRGG